PARRSRRPSPRWGAPRAARRAAPGRAIAWPASPRIPPRPAARAAPLEWRRSACGSGVGSLLSAPEPKPAGIPSCPTSGLHQRSDALVGEELGDDAVGRAPVDHVGLSDAAFRARRIARSFLAIP